MTKIEMEKTMAVVLKGGIVLSSAILLLGIALGYVRGAAPISSSLIVIGIFVLFSTPVVRVLLSVFSFMIERNRLYTAITVVVLIDILFAVFVLPLLIGA